MCTMFPLTQHGAFRGELAPQTKSSYQSLQVLLIKENVQVLRATFRIKSHQAKIKHAVHRILLDSVPVLLNDFTGSL